MRGPKSVLIFVAGFCLVVGCLGPAALAAPASVRQEHFTYAEDADEQTVTLHVPGSPSSDQPVVFLHAGGLPSVFAPAYAAAMLGSLP